MKILYAIQGTGNGHISRAIEILPILETKGSVETLISGSEFSLNVPFSVNYKFKGLNYVFGESGGINFFKTFQQINLIKLINDIRKIPIKKYDLIISDFEPISSWAAKFAGKQCIGLSNHAGILHPLAPQPHKSHFIGRMIVQHYAPNTFDFGFNFKSLGENIFTPIVRRDIRKLPVLDYGHYTVYLPSYNDKEIIKFISNLKHVRWEIFSRFTLNKIEIENTTIYPVCRNLFVQSMATSKGVICNAGFGVSSEALFLKKKLLVIPMKWQYEQHCNSAMLESMGVTVINKLTDKFRNEVIKWINSNKTIEVEYPDQTEEIIDRIIETNLNGKR